MEKTYYELCTFNIEMSKYDRRYNTPEAVYQHETNTTPFTKKRFKTLEAAQKEYEQRGYNVPDEMRDMGHYWLGELRYIEQNTYSIDEDGDEEWISGGDWIDCAFPIMQEGI